MFQVMWHITWTLSRFGTVDAMKLVMKCVIIMHSMVAEERLLRAPVLKEEFSEGNFVHADWQPIWKEIVAPTGSGGVGATSGLLAAGRALEKFKERVEGHGLPKLLLMLKVWSRDGGAWRGMCTRWETRFWDEVVVVLQVTEQQKVARSLLISGYVCKVKGCFQSSAYLLLLLSQRVCAPDDLSQDINCLVHILVSKHLLDYNLLAHQEDSFAVSSFDPCGSFMNSKIKKCSSTASSCFFWNLSADWASRVILLSCSPFTLTSIWRFRPTGLTAGLTLDTILSPSPSLPAIASVTAVVVAVDAVGYDRLAAE